MLAKLIKYDLKYILKSVTIFGSTLLICTVLFNITGYSVIYNGDTTRYTAPMLVIILHTIFYNAIYIVGLWMILNTIMRIWHRYRANFFLDESYLTHTLPIKRSTLWLSKFLSAIIAILAIFAVVGLSAAVLNLSPDGELIIANLGIKSYGDLDIIFAVIIVAAIFAQLLYSVMCGLVGITLGNRTGTNRSRNAILCGLAIYLLGALILVGCILLWSCFDQSIKPIIFGAEPGSNPHEIFTQDLITHLLAGILVIYAALITILYFTNRTLLQKGINID